jgi:glyoxylase I family protein
MTPPSIAGASHIALTVRDMDASAAWYQRVFGWMELRRFGPGEAGTPRVLLFDPASGFALAVCQPEDGSQDVFDHRRTGLDHFAFGMADEAAFEQWLAHLGDLGIDHSPVREMDIGKFVSFEDPDGIQFELWLNAR